MDSESTPISKAYQIGQLQARHPTTDRVSDAVAQSERNTEVPQQTQGLQESL
jgi:hypothetical protein